MADLQTKIICYFLYRIYRQLGGVSSFCDLLNASEGRITNG